MTQKETTQNLTMLSKVENKTEVTDDALETQNCSAISGHGTFPSSFPYWPGAFVPYLVGSLFYPFCKRITERVKKEMLSI